MKTRHRVRHCPPAWRQLCSRYRPEGRLWGHPPSDTPDESKESPPRPGFGAVAALALDRLTRDTRRTILVSLKVEDGICDEEVHSLD